MNVIEIFSCSGGMAEGLRRAVLVVDLAVDWDSDACDSYEANLGHRPIQIDVRDLVHMVKHGWCRHPVDLLIADPPCTPWSRAGKRLGEADERDMLSITIELVRAMQPRAFLIANVPGLDDAPNWPIVQRTIGSLHGYCTDFAQLDAADYGVPQHRVRPFWYGHRSNRDHIRWPERTHGSPEECANSTIPGVVPMRPWVTCREALQHLSLEQRGKPIRLRWRGGRNTSTKPRASHIDSVAGVVTANHRRSGDGNVVFDGPNHRPSRADAPARTITRNTHSDGSLLTLRVRPDGTVRESVADKPAHTLRGGRSSSERMLLVNDKHPINTPDTPSFTITTKGNNRGAQGACVMAWPWDRPSTTLQRDARIPPPGHHDQYATRSMPNAIKLSEQAAAILQGFPDGWVFCGTTKRSRWAQIGMAMPPPLAEAVGQSIRAAMNREREATPQ